MTATWTAPQWVHSFYSKFPLVVLEQEDRAPPPDRIPSLWITPGDSHDRPWASSDPECLRTQLILLLRNVPVTFRDWTNPQAAPGGSLPALHVASEKILLSADQIREWVDEKYPLDEFNGMPDQTTYDKAVALAQLILGRIKPTLTNAPNHQDMPVPPALSAGLTTPLPASLTGDERILDRGLLKRQAEQAWDAVEVACRTNWALGAREPTPLDALIAAFVFTQRSTLSSRHTLLEYAGRVLDRAQESLQQPA